LTIRILNAGEQALLEDGLTGVAYDLRLYKGDVEAGLTPAEIDALDEADFLEATFAGYSAAAVGTGDWTVTQGDPTQAVNVEKSFVRSSTGISETIWGYYVTRTSDGVALWFEPFDGPAVVEFVDDQIDVTPLMTLDDKGGNVGVPIGGSILWPGPTSAIPPGWLLRDGSAVSRSTYALLFAVIGETYGVGDGATTFNLPDQQGRMPIGVAASGTASVLGETGGAIDHVHGLNTPTSAARIGVGVGAPGIIGYRRKTGLTSKTRTQSAPQTVNNDATADTTGVELDGDSAGANGPYMAEYFIIRAL